MKQKLFSLFLAVLGLVVGTGVGLAQEAFADFAVQLTAAPFSDNTSTTSFNVKVDSSTGAASIVEAGEESTFSFTSARWNDGQHGWVNCVFTIPVNGPVKIGLGNCQFGDQAGTIVDSDNNSTTLTVGKSNCWSASDIANTTSYTIYKGTSATTLTVTYNGYCPYISVEAVDASELVSDATVSFSAGEATGMIVPASITSEVGSEITLPKNFTMYVEGKTLTGWSDGTTSYAPGTSYTVPSADITLDPVFTENTVSLADRTEPVTLKWNFRRDQGAPVVAWQNTNGNIWVTQATINNETIDVPMIVNTNPGKFNNSSNTDCAQTNNGTLFTIPSCKGAVVSTECHNSYSITTTTIDGQTDYTGFGTANISYEIANTAETIDIVIGDGSFYRYVQTVLPVVQQSGGTTYTDEEVTVTWPMNNPAEYSNSSVTLDGVFSNLGVDLGVVTLRDQNGKANVTGTSTVSPGVTFICMRPANNGNDYVTWTATPTTGLVFTPTNVSAYIVRNGTDAENGVTISAKVGNGDAITLGNFTAPRNNKTQAADKYGTNANYAEGGLVDIALTAEQQAALTSSETLSILGTIGVGNAKSGSLAMVTVTGTVSGTVADVETFTLAAAANIADGGTVTKYPNADEYDEGTEVTLTATKNFGYNFVNWTDADGNVVSTEATFKYTVDAAAELTANFEQINTYELKIAVDGTNDYMVKITPAPTVVDGKYMYEDGTTVELTADQYDGLVTFTNWSDGTTNSTKTVSMTEAVGVTANYAETDIIAGWDFYKKGSNGRVADFHSADNESAALTLVKTGTTETSGWLDKSTLAGGGYESFKGAATNWRTGSQNGDVGNWHWQTKVNAEAFQNINVQFQMMYNYNAYQTYNAEYSLDGETWVNFGSITMTGAKTAASFSESLPEECNNKANLWIRMVADKTSSVAGATSAYDGNTLAMFFITGTEQLQNDGVAPVVVSTVPAEGATGASATGKIVLTFDEKIKLQTAGAATLGTKTLTPSVSGKTVTYSYNGLKYNSEYTFTLPANTVSDLTDNVYAEPVTITFTTMQLPAVTKKKFDVIVGTKGNEDLQTVLDTYKTYNGVERKYIFIPDGTYKLRGNDSFTPKSDGTSWTWNEETGTLTEGTVTANTTYSDNAITILNGSNLSIIGQSKENTILYNIPYIAGISYTSTLELRGSESYLQDFTLKNMYAGGRNDKGVAVAFYDRGTHTIAKNVNMWSNQDTYVSAATRCYYETSTLAGTVDFICGGGDVWFQECELVINDRAGNVITAPSTAASEQWGFVFYDNTIRLADGATSAKSGNWNLGRPWQNSPASTFLYTKMLTTPSPAAWTNMGSGMVVRFHEYGSVDANGNAVDLSSRSIAACAAAEGSDEPVLTAAQAEQYTIENVLAGSDGWNPTEYTAQVSVENVSLSGNVLSWDNSDYALCWMVFKDGVYYDNVITNSIELTEEGIYTVRAANARGGLGESSESVTYAAPLILTTSRNMAGYRTFYDAENSYVADDNTIVYVAQLKRETEVVLSRLSGNVVPANAPVILKTTGLKENGTAGAYYQITLTHSDETVYYHGVNLLAVTTEGQDLSAGAYRLGWDAEDGVAFRLWNPSSASAGIVYLNVSSSLGAKLSIIFDEEEEDVTAVGAVPESAEATTSDETYNVAGQKVGKAYKGLVIRNGKKYNNK
ncbi:MAG: pectinesterase family protein [Prevotella sp.]|nr:pectinesterase family protein [Prevotella sp.]